MKDIPPAGVGIVWDRFNQRLSTSLSSPSRPAVFPTGFPAGWTFNYVGPFLVNHFKSAGSLSHVAFSRLDVHYGVFDTNMTIFWKHGRLDTAVWKWKESAGGTELVEHEEEEKGMATRAIG
ncbi:unnamed protein product [Penicillium camemberti]|uniref:Str. FM013 n=1 Tax=Penicillium camemberti (strain FM 013) TaxID=1429867 RepID=A0A0G4PGV1_PENC3|nr:unnamed protein product [Penicillium camemberti]